MATTRASISAALKLDNTAFKKGIGNSKKELNKFSSSVKSMAGVLAGAFTARALLNFATESSKLAAQMEGVAMAFERIRPSMGFMDDLKEATSGTVAELSLMKRAVMASNFKIPLEQLATLMQFATKRAQETGESVDYLVNSIVIGIGRKSPLILDNLGISAVELRKKLDHVGHSGATVGDVAKAVGAIASEEMANMGDIVETTAIKYERLAAQVTDFKTSLGGTVNEITVKMIPALENLLQEMLVIGRFFKTFWEGGNVFTGEWERRMEQDIRDGVGRSIEFAKKIIALEAKKLEDGGMGEEQALRKAIDKFLFRTIGQIAGSTGASQEAGKELYKQIRKWRESLDKYGVEGEAGVENIKNLKAELKALGEIQERLPMGEELTKVNARMKEINELITDLKGKTKEAKEETREFVSAIDALRMSADKGYKKAAEYFTKLAEEGQKLKTKIGSYLYDNDEVWAGGEEAWEGLADKMLQQKEIMSGMKNAIKRDLIDSFHALGTAIGETFAGIEGSLKKLAISIASNIGYILMMAGLQMLAVNPLLGAGLIVAGGALQLGSGIIRGLGSGSTVPGGQIDSGYMNSAVTFNISGENLVGVLDRQNNKSARFT